MSGWHGEGEVSPDWGAAAAALRFEALKGMSLNVSRILLVCMLTAAACESRPGVPPDRAATPHTGPAQEPSGPADFAALRDVAIVGAAEGTGEDIFGLVQDGVRLEDGWAVLLDSRALGLVLVDPSGRVRHRVGGRGSGPGEFRELRVLQRASAGVAVLDNGNRRYSEYRVAADTLALVRELPVEIIADDFCLLGEELFLLSAQNGRLVEVVGPDGRLRRGFGELPPQEHIAERFLRSVQATLAGGRIACVPERELVVVAYRFLPDVPGRHTGASDPGGGRGGGRRGPLE